MNDDLLSGRRRVIENAHAIVNGNGAHRPAPGGEDDEPLLIRAWPDPPADAAFHGVLGDIVATIEPHTEAAPVAILAQTLTGFGNLLNRGPHFIVENDRHALNLFTLLVAPTSVGRKGISWGRSRYVLTAVDPDWKGRIVGGLSSGEGLIAAVQDPVEKVERDKDGIERVVTVQAGVTDKRLMVVEPEFARVLRVGAREGNTLVDVMRLAWDSGDLNTMTKQGVRATGAHISIVGHIPAYELTKILDPLSVANGFLNRFLVICAKRSKCLPEGGNLDPSALTALLARLARAVDFGRKADRIGLDGTARELWRDVYPRLSEGVPGMLGAVTARAPAQVRRLACLYAVLDLLPNVGRPHLEAALALEDYVERSVAYIFGDSLGDPIAERILTALRQQPEGMTRSEIREHFSRHLSKPETDRALRTLAAAGLAVQDTNRETGGRPSEVWRVAPKASKAPKGRDTALTAHMAPPPDAGEAWEPEPDALPPDESQAAMWEGDEP